MTRGWLIAILATIGGGAALIWARSAGALTARVPAPALPAPVRPAGAPAPSTRPTGPLGLTDDDVDYLARMLVMEVGGGNVGTPEGAGVAWIAYNRMRRQGVPMRQIVGTTAWPGGGERGESFVQAIHAPAGTRTAYHTAPLGTSAYTTALTFSRHFAAGEIRNPGIGAREHFSHPRGFRDCQIGEDVGSGWTCHYWPEFGRKRVPTWLTVDPIVVGRAVFAR